MTAISGTGAASAARPIKPVAQTESASSGEANAKEYMVKRDFGDGYHSFERYVTTTKPNAGETIYHGNFQKRTFTEYYGPHDAYSREVTHWVPTGEVTSSKYTSGSDIKQF